MKIYPLTSSVIESVIDYFDDELNPYTGFHVRFKSGDLYAVPNATKQLLTNFLSAKSAGQFFNEIIKPNFDVQPVTEEWFTCGIASENIFTGDRLEVNKRGIVRRMKLPDLK